MKIALGTVIYSQARPYLQELLDSVTGQIDKDFDFLVVNDNYPLKELEKLDLSTMSRISLVDCYGKNLTPGLLRVELIKAAKERGEDLLIVADADDTFVSTKVQAYRKAFCLDKKYAFYYNDLVVKSNSNSLTQVLEDLPQETCHIRQISQCNYLGMSTTAINLNSLSYDFIESLRQGDTRIFDWYLFSRILMDLGPGCHVSGAETIYRIHPGNIVGVSHDVAQEREVKLTHYKNLAKTYPYFAYLYDKMKDLDISTIDTSKCRQGYWWSNILMEDSYEI